jgi:uncharacterized protein YbbC (DUF1343 family)
MPVRTGLEEFLDHEMPKYAGSRIGLVCHPASIDLEFRHALDRLAAARGVRLTAAFGPQHGARGEKQDNMVESGDYIDPVLRIPVYSLYGTHRQPTAEMLAEVDVLLCDLSDIGARVYTFITTMMLAMEACAELKKRFVVLDRPNPLGGMEIEGNVLDAAFSSFIGVFPLPMRHGLTLGELALLFNSESRIGADLEVIPMKGWKRPLWFDETGLPWIMPSPNIPTLETAIVYPGTVLMEGTNLSEGRGTTRPFEFIGAPFINPESFASSLNAQGLPGVYFRPVYFEPTFDKWQGLSCGGVQLHVTDRREFKPFRAGLTILRTTLEMFPGKFEWRQPPFEYEHQKLPIDILLGTDRIRRQLEAGETIASIESSWEEQLNTFRNTRNKYLLY